VTGGGLGGPSVAAVLLDLDDTLVDTRAAFAAGMAHVVETWLPHLDDDRQQAAVLHWAHDPGGHFRAFTRGELTFAEQRRRRVATLHATFDGPVLDDVRLQRWNDGYEAAIRAAWRALPDGIHLVAELRRRAVPFGVLTNMSADYQRQKLAVVGLGDVPVLVTTDDLGRGKPDPEVFRLGCRRLGVPPWQVAYIGDELDIDARGARDAGLVGIWVDRHGSGERPDDVLAVRLLTEVLDLVRFVAGEAGAKD
jgi:putative hydrolase of the HAD superfamily